MTRAGRSISMTKIWLVLLVASGLVNAGTVCTTSGVTTLTATAADQLLQDGDPSSASATYGGGQCQWRITRSTPGLVVRLFIEDWDFPQNMDHISVYDGSDATAPLVGHLYDSLTARDLYCPTFISSGASLFIVLSTDAFDHTGGFLFNYSEVSPPALWQATQTLSLEDDVYSGAYYKVSFPRDISYGTTYQYLNTSILIELDAGIQYYAFQMFSSQYACIAPGDILSVYDGQNASAPLLSRQTSGISLDMAVEAIHSNYLFITMEVHSTDRLTYSGGITIEIVTGYYNNPMSCRNHPVIDLGGGAAHLSFPAFGYYPLLRLYPNEPCEFEIRTSPGYVLSFEPNVHQFRGTLKVYDGNSTNALRLPIGTTTFPGDENAGWSVQNGFSTGNVALITFDFDPGYTSLTDTSNHIVFDSWICSVPINTQFCLGPQSLNASSGMVSFSNVVSGTDVTPYPRNRVCTWTVEGVSGNDFSVLLTLAPLLSGDSLVLTAIAANGARTPIRTIAGPTVSTTHVALNAAARRLEVVFTSGDLLATVAQAFTANVTLFVPAAMCDAAPVDVNVSTTTSRITAPYSEGMIITAGTACQWRLTAESGFIALSLTKIDLRASVDVLRVFDVTGSTATQILEYTGGVQPVALQTVYSSGRRLVVQLITGAGDATDKLGVALTAQSVASLPTPASCGASDLIELAAGQSQTIGINSADQRARQGSCVWRFVNTNWDPSIMGFAISGLDTLVLQPGDRLVIYDGAAADIKSPIVFTSDAAWDRVALGYIRSNTSQLVIEFTSGYLLGAAFSLLVTAESVPAGATVCNGMTQISLAPLGSVTIRPTVDDHTVTRPGMRCSWTVTSATASKLKLGFVSGPELPQNVLQLAGGTSLRIYNGNMTNSPEIIVSQGNLYKFLTDGPFVTIIFTTTSTWPSLAFVLTVADGTDLCLGKIESTTWQDVVLRSDTDPNPPAMGTSMPRTCVWLLHAPPHSFWMMTRWRNFLTANDMVRFYDGATAQSTLLDVWDADRLTYNKFTYGSDLLVVYQTDGTSNQGFQVNLKAVVRLDDDEAMPATNLTLRAAGQTTFSIQPGVELMTGSVDPNSWRVFSPPSGSVYEFRFDRLNERGQILITLKDFMDVSVELYYDGLLLRHAHHLSNDVIFAYLGSGDVFIRMTVHRGGPRAYWVVSNSVYSSTPYYPIRPAGKIICNHAIMIASGDDYTPYLPCHVTGLIYITDLNAVFPNLEVVYGELLLSGTYLIGSTTSTPFPKLKTLQRLSLIISANGVTELCFPSLEVNYEGYVENPTQIKTLSFPNMTHIYSGWYLHETLVSNWYLPKLQYLETAILQYFNYMPILNLPSLTELGYLELTAVAIETDLPELKKIRTRFTIQYQTHHTSISMPKLVTSYQMFLLDALQLTEIDLPKLRTVTSTITVSSGSALKVSTVNLPNLVKCNDFNLASSRLQQVSFPSLTTGGNFYLNNVVALTSLSLPLLSALSGFLLSGSTMTELSLPSLKSVGPLTLSDNAVLDTLDMCTLQTASSATASACPELSCYETRTLFGDVGAVITMTDADCSTTSRGLFGCRGKTLYVNTTECGFTVACIQRYLNYAYFDKRTQVSIPAGTFTGCSTPLSANGKRITVFGQSAGATVVDCQGTNRAFEIDSNENEGFELRDITLQNGVAGEGGLMRISATTPTLRRVRFINGTATTGSGGAVSVTLNAAVNFIDCEFSSSHALQSGGGLSLVGSRATLSGCLFYANSASVTGGGLSITSVDAYDVILSGGVLSGNRAAQGGGLFTDAPIEVEGAVFSNNFATQFGGGLAMIPADILIAGRNLIAHTTFTSNTAPTGGGVYVFSSHLEIINSTFTFNSVSGNGGGVSAVCSCAYKLLFGIAGACDMTVNLTNVTLAGNIADGDGGGIYAVDVYVIGVRVDAPGNAAGGRGGALYADSVVQSVESVFAHNMAGDAGGAWYLNSVRNYALLGEGLDANNTFDNNSVSRSGYGAQYATEAVRLSFSLLSARGVTANGMNEDEEIEARDGSSATGSIIYSSPGMIDPATLPHFLIGEYLASTNGSDALVVNLRDNLGQVALGVLTPILFSAYCDGLVTQPTVVGNTAVLLQDGSAVFNVYLAMPAPVLNASAVCTVNCADSAQVSRRVVSAQFVLVLQCPTRWGAIDEGKGIVCRACADGSTVTSELGAACIACPAGTYSNGDVCVTCPADSYAPTSGRTSCAACPGAAAGATECLARSCDPFYCGDCDTQQFCVTCQAAFANPVDGCNQCSDVTLTQFKHPDCRIKRVNQYISAGIISVFLVLIAVPTIVWSIKRPMRIQHEVTIPARKEMPFAALEVLWPMSEHVLTVKLVDHRRPLVCLLQPDERPFVIEPPTEERGLPDTFHIELTKEERRLLQRRQLAVIVRGKEDNEIPLNFPVRRSLENAQVLLSTLLEFIQLAAVGFSPYVPWSKDDPVISVWRNALVLLPDADFWPAIYWTVMGATVVFLIAMLVVVRGWNNDLADRYNSLKYVEAFISARYLPLIGSTLFLTVVGVLVSGLSCSRFVTADDTTPYVISSHRNIECWTPAHAPYALFSFALLILFVPVAVHYLPLWQVLLPTKDIRFYGEYLLFASQAKYFMICVASLFEGTAFVQIVAVVVFVTPLPIYLLFRPNSVIPFMRPLQIGLYGAVLWTAVASIVALASPGHIASSIVLYAGWGVMLIVMIGMVKRTAKITRMPDEKALNVNETVDLVRRGLAGNRDIGALRSQDFSREMSHEVSDYSMDRSAGSASVASHSGTGSGSGSADGDTTHASSSVSAATGASSLSASGTASVSRDASSVSGSASAASSGQSSRSTE